MATQRTALLKKAAGLAQQKQFAQAARIYRLLLEQNPGLTEAWVSLAGMFLKRRHEQSALLCLDRALRSSPKDHRICLLQADVLERMSRNKEALGRYNTALALNGRDALSWYKKGRLLNRMNHGAAAEECFEWALSLQPGMKQALTALAEVKIIQNQPQAALGYSLRALQEDENNPEALRWKGVACLALKRLPEAIRVLEAARILEPKHVEGHYQMARGLILCGDAEHALDSISDTLQLDPKQRDRILRNDEFQVLRESRQYRALLNQGDRSVGTALD